MYGGFEFKTYGFYVSFPSPCLRLKSNSIRQVRFSKTTTVMFRENPEQSSFFIEVASTIIGICFKKKRVIFLCVFPF